MADKPGLTAVTTLSLYPADLQIAFQLAAKAQVLVADVPKILGALQRLEQAVNSGKTFVELVPPPVERDVEASS